MFNNNTHGQTKNPKRTIEASSPEEDTPIAKRAKSQQPLPPGPTISNRSNRSNAPTSDSLSSAQDELYKVKQEEEEEELAPESSDSDDDDDQPIANSKQHSLPPPTKRSIDESSAASTTLTTNTQDQELKTNKKIKKIAVKQESISSSDDDQPLVARKAAPPKPTKKNQIKVKKEASDSEDSKPLIQTAPSKPQKKSKASANKEPKLESDEDKKPKTKRGKSNTNGVAVKKEAQSQAEIEEEEMYKWWEENKDDGTKKWTTLEHNGVLFPPEYEPLPDNVKMKYKGKAVDLPPESEEVAFFFGSMLNSDHVEKKVFCNNFFKDFVKILENYPPRDGTKIKEFSHCDFTPIFNYVEAEREKKKQLSNEQKKRLRVEKELAEAKYKTCLLDGRVEKVGNFRVEPPSLFRGRGQHPKTGMLKKRVQAEDITINCGRDSAIPPPPPGHQWGNIVHDDSASWLAFWKENINGNTKYVFLAAGSSLKGQSDMKKYEKARNLKEHIDRIRADYTAELKDKLMAVRQRATAMYLIDRFALRAGNEKGDDEAETYGCCSLKCEHVTLQPPNTLIFDFLGKDSIRFYNNFQVDEAVFKNIRIFKKNKAGNDDLFDRTNTVSLNKHLSECMKGLTAKVFRTYNASTTFERELKKNMDKLSPNATISEKMLAYNRANRSVAVLCNHQKTVSKTHETVMEKAIDKIRGLKYQRRRIRWTLLKHPDLDADTKMKWQDDEESDLEEEWIENHELALEEKKREAILKKYKKLQEEDEIERHKPESERQVEDEVKQEENVAVKQEERFKVKEEEEEVKVRVKEEEEPKVKEEEDKKPKKKPKTIPTTLVREEEKQNELIKIEGLSQVLKEEREKKTIFGDKRSVPQLIKALQSCDNSIFNAKSSLVDRDENKETALGTSKTNYIDPRISFAWAAKYGVDVKKIFPKTLQEKFTWAKTTEPDWKF